MAYPTPMASSYSGGERKIFFSVHEDAKGVEVGEDSQFLEHNSPCQELGDHGGSKRGPG